MALSQKERYVVDLPALQALYERNYLNLRRLLPKMRERNDSRTIAFMGERRLITHLTFTVLENTPYTSYLLLKQNNLLPWLTSPVLYIRCYHDAKLAEITFAQNTRSFRGVYAYPNKAMHQPDEKRQLNQFLEESLLRCLSSGYEVKDISLSV